MHKFLKNFNFFLFSQKGRDRLVKLEIMTRMLAREVIFSRYNDTDDGEIAEAIDYLKSVSCLEIFPYSNLKFLDNVDSGYNSMKHLPYVIHNNKRLYFRRDQTIENASMNYRWLIEEENLLGGGFKKRCPHCYQTDTFKVEEGDILVDVGCAEALVSLDVIEKVKRVYLIECNKKWHKPLKETFAPYKDKVVLIPKMMTSRDTTNEISLSSILEREQGEHLFIKMDIEGAEVAVIQAALPTLTKYAKNIKLALCTYHRPTDAEKISRLVTEAGLSYSFSEGFMLTDMNDETMIPSLRRGLIRAYHKK